MRRSIFVLAVTFLCAGFIYFNVPALLFSPTPFEPVFDQRLEIRSPKQSCVFQVAMANTMQTRLQGLMRQTALAEDRGMLFDFLRDGPISMWMKDTPVSLDILFIDGKGVVRHIAPATTPNSTDPIASGAPVRAALEVVAGTVKRCGIAVESTVIHTMFDKP